MLGCRDEGREPRPGGSVRDDMVGDDGEGAGGASRVVRAFFEAMQNRDWAAAEALVAGELSVWWPVTLERFEGRAFVAMNRAYPEGWSISVREVIEDGDQVAA